MSREKLDIVTYFINLFTGIVICYAYFCNIVSLVVLWCGFLQ